MAQQSLFFKKKDHFLQLIQGIPPEKILFCPIDVSKDFHVAIFHTIQCQPLSDFFDFSASQLGFQVLVTHLEQRISRQAPQLLFIGMEPTNVYYEPLLHALHRRYGAMLQPRVQLGLLNPAAVRANRKQRSLPYHKTDQIDTAAIGELLTRGLYTPAHFSSPERLALKELSRSIHDYRQQYLGLWNRMLTTLDRVFPNLLIQYQDETPLCRQPLRSVLFDDLLHVCPDPYTLLELTTDDLIDLFHQKGRPLGPQKARRIQQAAQRALCLPQPYQPVYRQTLTHQLETLDFLKNQIQRLRQQLVQRLGQTPARHVAAIAGNSQLLTADFIAALEDWERYPYIQSVWAAAGLAPTEDQSGRRRATPHISHLGSVYLRNAIYKMTASVVWHEPTFGIPCFQRLLQGQAFVPTVLHVGRKLTNTALALLRTDQPFHAPFADYAQAQATLRDLQHQYQQQKKRRA